MFLTNSFSKTQTYLNFTLALTFTWKSDSNRYLAATKLYNIKLYFFNSDWHMILTDQ